MSEQPDGFLQMGASYNFDRNKSSNYRNQTIQPSGFQQWTKDHMYKSSYAQFHSRDSANPKNTAIPGYSGYIPSIKAENIHGKGYTPMAKQSFHGEKLGKNLFGLATTGFNLNRNALIDDSKFASSSKYGKSEIQRAHPGWNGDWKTTTHSTFKDPKVTGNPCYRSTDKYLQTTKPKTKASGFATNYSFLDGKGWTPDPVLRGDISRSQYRDRFNAALPFHRNVNVSKKAQLARKQLNYQYN